MKDTKNMDTNEEIQKKAKNNSKNFIILSIIIALIAFIINRVNLIIKNKNSYEKNEEKSKVIINFEKNKIMLTERFKKELFRAKNPKIILCIGETRVGKSTLLNNIIKNKNSFWFDNKHPFKNKTPFITGGGVNAVTKEFHYYGPISNKELLKRNNFHFSENESEFEEFDLFFIDSEGAFNLNGDTGLLFHSIFALQSISTYILYVVSSVPNSNNLETIKNELAIINLLNKEIELNSPKLIIVANRIKNDDNFKELSNEEQEKQTFYDSEFNINENLNEILDKNLTFYYIIQWYLGIESTKTDINLYWKTIEKITSIISEKSKKNTQNDVENLVSNFELIISIIEKAKLMNSTNFRNSEEIFSVFIDYKLDQIIEDEKKDIDKTYERLINEKINNISDEDFLKMLKNNENISTFLSDFELKCNIIIKKNIIAKFRSLENKKDKLESAVKEIYLSIYSMLIDKTKIRLNELREKFEKEGKKQLVDEISGLTSSLDGLKSKLYDLQYELRLMSRPLLGFDLNLDVNINMNVYYVNIPVPVPKCSIF